MDTDRISWQDSAKSFLDCFYIDIYGNYDILYGAFPPAAIIGAHLFQTHGKSYRPNEMQIFTLYVLLHNMLNNTVEHEIGNNGDLVIRDMTLTPNMKISDAEHGRIPLPMFEEIPEEVTDVDTYTVQFNAATLPEIARQNRLDWYSDQEEYWHNKLMHQATDYYNKLTKFFWRI